MRTWARVTYVQRCGMCGAHLAVGSPIQTINVRSTRRTLVRCPDCADGDVPPDLPEHIVRREPETAPLRKLDFAKSLSNIVERPRYGEDH